MSGDDRKHDGSMFPPSSKAPMTQKHRRRDTSVPPGTHTAAAAPSAKPLLPLRRPEGIRLHGQGARLLGRRGGTSSGVLDFFAKLMILYESMDLLPKMCVHIHGTLCASANSIGPRQPRLREKDSWRRVQAIPETSPTAHVREKQDRCPPRPAVWRRRHPLSSTLCSTRRPGAVQGAGPTCGR